MVVAKIIWRADCAVGARNRLRFIEKIGEGKVELCRPALHVFQRIFGVDRNIVAHDGDASDAKPGQFSRVAHDAVNDRLDVRAVVAHENDQQPVGAAATLQRMAQSVYAWQFKVGSRQTEFTDGRIKCGHNFPLTAISPIIAPMNLPRFYCREALAPGAHIDLPEPVARHAVRVLRLPPGAAIVLFDGRGGEYEARIQRIERERVVVELGAWRDVECESRLSVTLVQALQAGDKMDFTIQKAVELGVRDVVPVDSRRSVIRLAGERAAKRVAHWQGVAAAACEQCGRNQVPNVAPLEKLEHWLARPPHDGLRLMLLPEAGETLADLPPFQQVELLIGAEGGLDPQEVTAARQAGFRAVRLGPRILRTETAGLAVLAAMQALWGDFREG